MGKKISVILIHIVVIVLIIVFVGVLGIFAKDGNDKHIEKFTSELETNVTIRILENDTAKEQGYLDELLTAFNQEYSDKNIVAVDANMGDYVDLEQDGPYGYGPDVLYQANDAIMKYVDGRHIQPLPVNTLEAYDKIDDKGWDAYTSQVGSQEYVFGVPVNIQGPVLYYRKDLLPTDWKTQWDDNSNNVPDMVENWCDLYQYSKQVKSDSNGRKFGYMKSLFDSYFASGYLFSYGAYVFGDNGKDTEDIGYSNEGAEKGARIINQLASVMNEDCIDDTITLNAYSKMGEGTYFATMTTPDVYTLFIKELKQEYRRNGYSSSEAEALAKENLVVTNVPSLPVSGDLEDQNPEFMPAIMMGGVNGYAISSYTKAPNASLAFVNFATKYEMIKRRNELLGIAPARVDVATELGGLVEIINGNLTNNHIYVMPSVSAIAQVWTPTETFYSDIAKDPFRPSDKKKYLNLDDYRAGLKKVDKQIYDSIHTLGG